MRGIITVCMISVVLMVIAITGEILMPESEAAAVAIESNGYHYDGEEQASTVKPSPPPATIIADEVDSLRFHSMQLDASGRRARADALNAQATILESQASQMFEAIRLKLCKAHGLNPEDYPDGQFSSEKGLVLVRKEAPLAKP